MTHWRDGFYTREEAEAYLAGSEQLIGPILRQRQYLAQHWLVPIPCPNCTKPMPLVDAEHVDGDVFRCAHCQARIRHIVPLFAYGAIWDWSLEPHQIKAGASG